jgi:hypothetical protein
VNAAPDSDPIEALLHELRREHPEIALELLAREPEHVQLLLAQRLLDRGPAPGEQAAVARALGALRSEPLVTEGRSALHSILAWLTQALVPPRVATLAMGGHFGHGEETPKLLLHATPDAAPRAVPLDHARVALRAGDRLELGLRFERPSEELCAALACGSFELELLETQTQQSLGSLEAVVATRRDEGLAREVDLVVDLRALGVATQKLGRIDPQALRIQLFA